MTTEWVKHYCFIHGTEKVVVWNDKEGQFDYLMCHKCAEEDRVANLPPTRWPEGAEL